MWTKAPLSTEWKYSVKDGDTIITIDGSRSFLDWIVNFVGVAFYVCLFGLSPYLAAAVFAFWMLFGIHIGAGVRAILLYPRIRRINDKPVFSNCHSAGGAVAIILAAAFGTSAVVWGAHRVFGLVPSLIAGRRADITRVVYGNDIVEQLPPYLSATGSKRQIGPKRTHGVSIRDHDWKNYWK